MTQISQRTHSTNQWNHKRKKVNEVEETKYLVQVDYFEKTKPKKNGCRSDKLRNKLRIPKKRGPIIKLRI